MTESNFVELVLTCGSWQEAQKVADVLLGKRLIACVEFMEVKSKYQWHHHLKETKKVKLILQADFSIFDKIELEVRKLHSYDIPTVWVIPPISQAATKQLEVNANG